MKRACMLLLACALVGCNSAKAYEEIPVTMDEVVEMCERQEDFVLMVERENCPFCEELHELIDKSKQEHPGVQVYVLDVTSFQFKKEGDTLISESEEGKAFLELFPYFLYTPSIYEIRSGEAVQVGVGFDAALQEVSVWDVDSIVDFHRASDQNVWKFIEGAQGE